MSSALFQLPEVQLYKMHWEIHLSVPEFTFSPILLPPELRRAKEQGRDVGVASIRSRKYEVVDTSIQVLS